MTSPMPLSNLRIIPFHCCANIGEVVKRMGITMVWTRVMANILDLLLPMWPLTRQLTFCIRPFCLGLVLTLFLMQGRALACSIKLSAVRHLAWGGYLKKIMGNLFNKPCVF